MVYILVCLDRVHDRMKTMKFDGNMKELFDTLGKMEYSWNFYLMDEEVYKKKVMKVLLTKKIFKDLYFELWSPIAKFDRASKDYFGIESKDKFWSILKISYQTTIEYNITSHEYPIIVRIDEMTDVQTLIVECELLERFIFITKETLQQFRDLEKFLDYIKENCRKKTIFKVGGG